MSPTRRLDREDPYCRQFSGRVVEETVWEGQPAVVLDASCFYPTAGGQPHDTGTLNDVPVIDVVEDGERILHVLERPLASTAVVGQINWQRRIDHMQQHTGQHILSQAFVHVLQADTVAFHLGAASSSIDVSLPSLDWADAHRVEDLANHVVLENRPVIVQEYPESEIGALGLRKPPVVHGLVRIVQVADFDASACGGTHVRATGEVGAIKILGWERHRGNVRVSFVCGGRALADYRARLLAIQALSARLSAGLEDLPAAVDRLAEEARAADRRAEELQERLAAAELPALVARAERVGELRLIAQVLEGYTVPRMRQTAQTLAEQPGVVALLAVATPAPQLCFARAANVLLDMGELLREVVTPLGGKGGGKPALAQGGGVPAASLAQVLEAAQERIRALVWSAGS